MALIPYQLVFQLDGSQPTLQFISFTCYEIVYLYILRIQKIRYRKVYMETHLKYLISSPCFLVTSGLKHNRLSERILQGQQKVSRSSRVSSHSVIYNNTMYRIKSFLLRYTMTLHFATTTL